MNLEEYRAQQPARDRWYRERAEHYKRMREEAERARLHRQQAANESAFIAGAHQQAVLYWSRLVYRKGNLVGWQ